MNFPSFLSECFSASWAFGILVLCFLSFFMSCSSFSLSSPSSYPPVVMDIAAEFHNYTAISEFRMLNRRHLMQCPDPNEFIRINVSSNSTIGDEEFITVNVSGILKPAEGDWVAMISPSNSRVSACPLDRLMYAQTGDLSKLPLLCHYPVKDLGIRVAVSSRLESCFSIREQAQFLSNDPAYLGCNKKECKSYNAEGQCEISTCSSSLSFHVINIRTDVQFVLFAGGFKIPCILKRSNYLSFANPHKPLYGHLSSIDSTGTSMRLTWVSGDQAPQQVQYGDSKSQTSQVSTFSQQDMCTSPIPSPAQDFGWHDPGYIHSAVMTGLRPSSTFSYRYGSDSVGWSDQIQFQTPPAAGSDKLKFLAFGDMGKAPLDASVEHYIQPGSITVAKAMADEVASGNIDSIFHIGDISYATGFLVEWDYFLHQIFPVASRVSYMTAIGNHERDYVYSGSKYITPDSGGECGVPYETYFQMPTPAQDKPWYSIEQASVHFTVISTEHSWFEDSEQYEWMKKDMASVNRSVTPWLIFIGHRPMYSSCTFGLLPGAVDREFVGAVESLLLTNKVDLVLFGHVHNYERTCRVYQSQCLGMPTKNADGIDVYDNSNYTAPVQAVIGMAGFTLDKFPENNTESWSLSRVSEYGYVRINATRNELMSEYVNANSREVEDSFCIIKKQASYQKYSACSRITICYTRIFSVVLCNFFICDLLQRIFCSMYIKSSLY